METTTIKAKEEKGIIISIPQAKAIISRFEKSSAEVVLGLIKEKATEALQTIQGQTRHHNVLMALDEIENIINSVNAITELISMLPVDQEEKE